MSSSRESKESTRLRSRRATSAETLASASCDSFRRPQRGLEIDGPPLTDRVVVSDGANNRAAADRALCTSAWVAGLRYRSTTHRTLRSTRTSTDESDVGTVAYRTRALVTATRFTKINDTH